MRRRVDPADRRVIRVGLEPATFAAFARVYAPLGHTVHGATARFSDRRRREAAAALDTIAVAFDTARGSLEAPGVSAVAQAEPPGPPGDDRLGG